MIKLLSAVTGFALLTAAATVSADPVTLTSAQLDQVTAGGYGGTTFKYSKYINVRVRKHFDVSGIVDPYTDPVGHLADAEANATAEGIGTFSETLTQTHTTSPSFDCCSFTPGTSTSNSVSLSGSAGLTHY